MYDRINSVHGVLCKLYEQHITDGITETQYLDAVKKTCDETYQHIVAQLQQSVERLQDEVEEGTELLASYVKEGHEVVGTELSLPVTPARLDANDDDMPLTQLVGDALETVASGERSQL